MLPFPFPPSLRPTDVVLPDADGCVVPCADGLLLSTDLVSCNATCPAGAAPSGDGATCAECKVTPMPNPE